MEGEEQDPQGSQPASGVRMMVVRLDPPEELPPALVACVPDLPVTARVWGLLVEDDSFPLTLPKQGMLPEWPRTIGNGPGPSFPILPDDTLFWDSPAAGALFCVCSRCGEAIDEGDELVRCPCPDGGGSEYRFHAACVVAGNL